MNYRKFLKSIFWLMLGLIIGKLSTVASVYYALIFEHSSIDLTHIPYEKPFSISSLSIPIQNIEYVCVWPHYAPKMDEGASNKESKDTQKALGINFAINRLVNQELKKQSISRGEFWHFVFVTEDRQVHFVKQNRYYTRSVPSNSLGEKTKKIIRETNNKVLHSNRFLSSEGCLQFSEAYLLKLHIPEHPYPYHIRLGIRRP